jgi:DNA-binding MarR family transcriptional regulator/N-acetylglutamate synthase-like GNAT family acetyltransferase
MQAVAAFRNFNRIYTRQLGLLSDSLYDSSFSLSEVRVLYELAHQEKLTASDLVKELGLDPGYLSRILRGFGKSGFVDKIPSKQDRRQLFLRLTERGRGAFALMDRASSRQISAMLNKLSSTDQKRLVEAMSTVQQIIGPAPASNPSYILRTHQPGDMGWMVHRHGVLYSQEYGYDERFEALVAEIAAEFIQNFDPQRERCWIAEKNGENVGCVLLVRKSEGVAKLRVLLVETSARGMGIGKRLVDECVRFARRCGYKKIMLWTQSELTSARHIYQQAGFRLAGKERHNSWSRTNLVAETWELKL